MESASKQLLGQARFSEDFILEDSSGTPGDTDAIALLLPTVFRSAETCAETFDAGAFECLEVIGAGQCLTLELKTTECHFARYEGVRSWEDQLATEAAPWPVAGDGLPVFRDYLLLREAFRSLPGATWIGLRASETNQWQSDTLASQPAEAEVRKATMAALQMDILLKGQEQPRGRMRLCFQKGELWAWASSDDDYLMAYLAAHPEASDLHALAQIGEAFLLGPVPANI